MPNIYILTVGDLRPFREVVDHVLSCSPHKQGPVLIGEISTSPTGVSQMSPGRQRKVEQLLIGVLSNQDIFGLATSEWRFSN